MELKDIVLGMLVKRTDKPEVVGQVRRISDKGNAGLLVEGKIQWVAPEKLEPLHG